jgi:hypothetical protein
VATISAESRIATSQRPSANPLAANWYALARQVNAASR